MAHVSTSINLFKGRDRSFSEKFIDWALTFGRVVVIVTEGVALAAFLYRFSLDRQLIDLHEKIKQKETIVKLLKKDEDKYRNLQDRITLASSFSNKSSTLEKTFEEIVSLIPKDFIVNNLTLSTKNIRLDVDVKSIKSLSQFVNLLRASASIGAVSLDKIENKIATATIAVGITATFKEDLDK